MSNPAGRNPFSRVVEVRAVDPADNRRWIGWCVGYSDPMPHPESAAALWMQSTATEICNDLVPSVFFTAATAAKVAQLCRQIRRSEGYTVLSGRLTTPPTKWREIEVDGVKYRSLRSAAKALGIGRWTLWNQVRLGRL
jgi:hypothetical protein